MWNPNTQKFWVATNRQAFNKQPSTTEYKDIENIYINVLELGELVKQGHPHCDPIGLNQSGRPGWTEEMSAISGPFLQRPYGDSPRCKGNSYLTNIVVMEVDGDGALQDVLNNEELRKILTLVYTSCSHGKKDGDRFRLVFVLGRRLETFHDSTEHTNPHWQLEAIWDYCHSVLVKALGCEKLSDTSGREAARQFFGCNSNYKIGLGPLADEYPEPCQVHFTGGGLDALQVNQLLDAAEFSYVKSSVTNQYDYQHQNYSDSDELSSRDANIINWILTNGVLDNSYATDRNKWFTIGRVLKKYDPNGEIFFEAFVIFSQQCTEEGKRDGREELEMFWEQLPSGEDTEATFNCIKSYATSSNEEWRNQCPYYGGTTTMTKATKDFVSGSISTTSARLLSAMEDRNALSEYESILRANFESRIANINVSTAENTPAVVTDF